MTIKILAVDDEQAALNRMVKAIYKAHPTACILGFTDPYEAVQHIVSESFQPEVAFLDIEMYGMTGLELARQVKELCPETKIVFATAWPQYALEAFSIHARGYLLKPVTPERIREELDEMDYQMAQVDAYIRVQTFGNFEIFVNEEPVIFRRSKAKEILAYLIDRKGAGVTKKEIAGRIWEDKEYSRKDQIYLQTLISEMMKALKEVKADHMVRKGYNSFSVDRSQFDCDYYRFEQWDTLAINAYHGEYMSNYSWAEFTLGHLEKQSHDKIK